MKTNQRTIATRKKVKRSLGAVIINYRTPEDTVRCAESLLAQKLITSPEDIVIVENNSEDDSTTIIRRRLPKVTLVVSPDNRGFGAGVNLGVSHCEQEFIVVLNPDTHFVDNAMPEVFKHFKDPKVAIIGFNLINDDGSPQYSARTFYSFATIILRRTPLKKLKFFKNLEDEHLMKDISATNGIIEAPWVVGAGFVMRRSVFVDIEGMDEKFFLYLEDTDLCRRVWRAGYKVCVAVDATLMHTHQRQSARAPLSRSNLEHLKSLVHYISKYGLPILGHDHIK